MRKTILALTMILTLAFAAAWAGTPQQDQQKAMEAYMKAAAVTENHAVLKFYEGKWDVSLTMWTAPGQPPTFNKSTAVGTLILGGRFVQVKYTGTMMGQPFEGLLTAGYSNLGKKYEKLWIDNTSTSFYLLTGTYDAAKKTFTDMGQWNDPLGGTTPVRMVDRILGPDEFVSETYMKMPDGKEFKSMEEHAKRVK